MRKFIYLFTSFVALALFMVQLSFAADPNDYRKPNMWASERTINDSINKSSVTVEASKTYPVSTLGADGKPIKQMRTAKSTITLAASAKNVSKTLFKRTPAIAISYAVTALLGKSVDWLLDEENNSLKYLGDGGTVLRYICNYNQCKNRNPVYLDELKSKFLSESGLYGTDGVFEFRGTHVSGSSTVSVWYVLNGANYNVGSSFDEEQHETPYVHIPIDDVSNQIISDAQSGENAAMQVMTDSALDALEAGLLDAQLDAASDIPQPDPEEISQSEYDGSTDPDPDPEPQCPSGYTKEPSGACVKTEQTLMEFPPFCDWASKVCDFIDWVQTEPIDPGESGDISVEQPDPDMHVGILERLYIDMPAACPADPILEFMGAKIPFPMSIFCQFAEMMKPLILLFAYIKTLSNIGNGFT